MVKVIWKDKLVYKVYIWVLFGIIFGKEKEAFKMYLWSIACLESHITIRLYFPDHFNKKVAADKTFPWLVG